MPTPSHLTAFALLALVLIVIPGPNVLFVVSRSLTLGRAAGEVPLQMLVLGAVFLAIAVVCDSSYALAAGSARDWLARSPRRIERIGGASGLVMIGIGASLALTGRKD